MTQTLIETWMPSDLIELRDAVNEIISATHCDGIDPYTIYVDVRDLRLVHRTLTDGSTAADVIIRENR